MQQQSSFDTLLTLDDNALLNLISEGNDDAVSALVLRYLSLVRKKVSGIHLASMDADDLTQEGVIGLMDAIRTYRKDGGSSFATYASTCVDNRIRKAIAHANTGKNRAFASSLTLDEAPVTMLADQAENPEAIVIAKERLQMLQKKIMTRWPNPCILPKKRLIMPCNASDESLELQSGRPHCKTA